MNAYVHIPFCGSICSYCDFTSFAGQGAKVEAYVEALVLEIGASSLLGPLRTVYFGGGTPSLLSAAQVGSILDVLRGEAGLLPGAEISLEANPETVDEGKLLGYRKTGVNRLSFGAQASQKGILRDLGRGHDWGTVEKAVGSARRAGFDNVNLDLMFGLPGQSSEDFRGTMEKALALAPDHLSLYALQVEEGTPMARRVAEGLRIPDGDETADLYAATQEFLERSGYGQYEVSNFSRPDKECRHNLAVWRGEDYWGFGVGAVGTVGNLRVSHGEDLEGYLRSASTRDGFLVEKEDLPEAVRDWERLMLGLRTREGVREEMLERFLEKARRGPRARFDRLLKEGFLLVGNGRVRVAPKGYFILNGILETLAA